MTTAANRFIQLSRGEDEIKFETYRYYLKCIIDYLVSTYGDWQAFGEKILRIRIKSLGLDNLDMDFVSRFLKIAWNTEYISCNIRFKDIDTVKINNQWKPIQIYYAIYAVGEVLSYLVDGNKANGHKKSLKKLSEFFVKQKIYPWGFAFKGRRGRSKKEHYPINFPADLKIPHSNLQRYDIQPIQMIGKCLKAEHFHRIDENFKKQRGVYKYNFDPRYTTILHFLYRLRIKSNYRDVGIFLADVSECDIKEFAKNLEVVCFWTLLLFEILIIKRGGFTCFYPMVNHYRTKNKAAKQLQIRFNFYVEQNVWRNR